jgi:hypothetical protein
LKLITAATARRFAPALCLSLTLGCVTPVFAQQQATPATPAQPAAPPISPSHLAIARDLVISSGMSRGFDALIPQFMEQLKQTFAASRPEIAKELADTLTQLRPEFDAKRDEIVDTAARLYAQALSENDLKNIAAFFKSPSGSAYVASQPRVLDGLFGAMQAWSRGLSEFMLTRVRAELKKKNIDL